MSVLPITEAAQRGLEAWQGEFTEEKRRAYIEALGLVYAHLSTSVDCPIVLAFLRHVLDSEIQGAPHFVVGEGGADG